MTHREACMTKGAEFLKIRWTYDKEQSCGYSLCFYLKTNNTIKGKAENKLCRLSSSYLCLT